MHVLHSARAPQVQGKTNVLPAAITGTQIEIKALANGGELQFPRVGATISGDVMSLAIA